MQNMMLMFLKQLHCVFLYYHVMGKCPYFWCMLGKLTPLGYIGCVQEKLLNGWVRISVMRKLSVENRCEIEKLKHGMKLYHILRSDMELLNQWWRIEAKNVEAVGRVVRKLSAVSLCLPLVQNATVLILYLFIFQNTPIKKRS